MRKICNKCGYERQEADTAPDYECPKCGVIYAKVKTRLQYEKELVRRKEEKKHQKEIAKKAKQKKIVIKTYMGSQALATSAFQADATKMADQGYCPRSQTWAPGSYGCGAFLIAILLCFILIGFLVFVYMLIVKPAGTLSVTYELRSASSNLPNNTVADEKTCPQCAEKVKVAALVCHFCGHKFE